MTYPTLSLTETQTMTALQAFLQAVLPPTVVIVRGQMNRVPQPGQTGMVVMTPLMRERITMNQESYVDGAFNDPVTPGINNIQQSVKVTVQLDVHSAPDGPSADYAHAITTLFRSEWGVDQFQTSGFDVTPLYCDEPHQVPFTNGEQQVENRWVVDAHMQCNPIVTVSQDFADQAKVDLINVDVVYPPT